MQLVLIALVLGIFIHNALVGPEATSSLPWWIMLAVAAAPKLVWAGLYALACRRTYRRLSKPQPGRTLRRLDRVTGVYRLGVVALYLSDLWVGALLYLRETIGDVVLLDELLLLLPTVALLAFGWWAYYPIDRRLREAALIRQADRGEPLYPIWTRRGYVVTHLRHEVALILVPLLLVMAWVEIVPPSWPAWGIDVAPLVVLSGAVVIFILAPTIIRFVWDTTPLPAGTIRDRLLAMCRTHRVRVRDVLLWRTHGGMINAAVMGLIAPLRYILLTDGLLDQVREKQVEAVMAHELAHVRRRHMFWLLGAALASLGAAEIGFHLLFSLAAGPTGPGPSPVMTAGFGLEFLRSDEAILITTSLCALLTWAAVFGWVSRRAERQADTFAVQHLTAERGLDTIDAEAVMTMISALQQVADLNHLPTQRHNWRHGSIAWRQDYLRTLVGRPVDDVSIDRLMNRIKLATLIGIGAVAAAYFYLPVT